MAVDNELTEDLLIERRRKVGKLPPDTEDMNNARAEAALRALRSFGKDFGEDFDNFEGDEQVFMVQQNAKDLLVNVAHLFDRLGLDLGELVESAKSNYEEETDNVGGQFRSIRG